MKVYLDILFYFLYMSIDLPNKYSIDKFVSWPSAHYDKQIWDQQQPQYLHPWYP